MEIKTITYQRVLNVGNYESKRLEMFAELHPGDNVEAETSHLMETVERKVREEAELIIEAKELRSEIRSLKKELAELKAEKEKLTGTEPDPDDIPFEVGAKPDTQDLGPANNPF